jgi:hypothetical protein
MIIEPAVIMAFVKTPRIGSRPAVIMIDGPHARWGVASA